MDRLANLFAWKWNWPAIPPVSRMPGVHEALTMEMGMSNPILITMHFVT